MLTHPKIVTYKKYFLFFVLLSVSSFYRVINAFISLFRIVPNTWEILQRSEPLYFEAWRYVFKFSAFPKILKSNGLAIWVLSKEINSDLSNYCRHRKRCRRGPQRALGFCKIWLRSEEFANFRPPIKFPPWGHPQNCCKTANITFAYFSQQQNLHLQKYKKLCNLYNAIKRSYFFLEVRGCCVLGGVKY